MPGALSVGHQFSSVNAKMAVLFFFDELGPPWPKHPCTDNSRYKYRTPQFANGIKQCQREWERNGWFPVVVENSHRKSNFAFRIERVDKSIDNQIEVMIYSSYSTELTKKDVLIFFKRKGNQNFLLTAFDVNNHKEIEFELSGEDSKLNKFCNRPISIFYNIQIFEKLSLT